MSVEFLKIRYAADLDRRPWRNKRNRRLKKACLGLPPFPPLSLPVTAADLFSSRLFLWKQKWPRLAYKALLSHGDFEFEIWSWGIRQAAYRRLTRRDTAAGGCCNGSRDNESRGAKVKAVISQRSKVELKKRTDGVFRAQTAEKSPKTNAKLRTILFFLFFNLRSLLMPVGQFLHLPANFGP